WRSSLRNIQRGEAPKKEARGGSDLQVQPLWESCTNNGNEQETRVHDGLIDRSLVGGVGGACQLNPERPLLSVTDNGVLRNRLRVFQMSYPVQPSYYEDFTRQCHGQTLIQSDGLNWSETGQQELATVPVSLKTSIIVPVPKKQQQQGNNTSSTLVLSTGTPQGCVLSPALFTLFTSDCSAIHSTNTIVKFADDTTIVGLISDNDETHYREEIQHLTQWCSNNNLVLNTSKTKEVIVDYRRSRRTEHAPLLIHGEAVERVNNIKFLGIHIRSDLTWSMNTAHLVKKAQQRLFFLRKLKLCWTLPSAPDKLLQGHNREHPLPQCSSVVWQLNCTRPKGLSPGGENTRHWDCGKSSSRTGLNIRWADAEEVFIVKNNLHLSSQVNRTRGDEGEFAAIGRRGGLIDFTRGPEVTHQLTSNKTSQAAVKEKASQLPSGLSEKIEPVMRIDAVAPQF
ncbi:hypothetical protein L3Q82_015182, partial [Scortum barcoo]